MTVRDLGYRAYEGELLPASHNTWVLLRYGLWRIWGSWINKLVIFVAVLPPLGYIGLAILRFAFIGREFPEALTAAQGGGGWFMDQNAATWVRSLTAAQFWFFVTIVTLRSGAGVIAEDFTHKAYQFYFAKPVTWVQYFVGRAAALGVVIFGLVFVPTSFLVVTLAAVGPEDMVLERVGLLLPALIDALIISVSCSVLPIAISGLSKSRALTMTAWVVLLFVPFVLALLVEGISDWEWTFAGSLPGLLWVIGDGLYKIESSWQHLQWYHAAPVLALLNAGAVYFAYNRIRQAEVIT